MILENMCHAQEEVTGGNKSLLLSALSAPLQVHTPPDLLTASRNAARGAVVQYAQVYTLSPLLSGVPSALKKN